MILTSDCIVQEDQQEDCGYWPEIKKIGQGQFNRKVKDFHFFSNSLLETEVDLIKAYTRLL